MRIYILTGTWIYEGSDIICTGKDRSSVLAWLKNKDLSYNYLTIECWEEDKKVGAEDADRMYQEDGSSYYVFKDETSKPAPDPLSGKKCCQTCRFSVTDSDGRSKCTADAEHDGVVYQYIVEAKVDAKGWSTNLDAVCPMWREVEF